MTISPAIESKRPMDGRDSDCITSYLFDSFLGREIGSFTRSRTECPLLSFIFAIDMLLRDRHRKEALLLDQIAADNADAIRSALDALQSFIELLYIIARPLRLKEMLLALHGVRALLGSMQGKGLILPVEFAGGIHELL